MRRLPRFLAALAIAASIAACQPIDSPATANPGDAPTAPNAVNAAQAVKDLQGLSVKAGNSLAGYSRTKFHIWASQGDGCDTRDVVLKRDGKGVKATSDCKITAGTWVSPYNGKTYTDPLQLDIDHIVPLANAWRSGAADWTDDQRKAFANDLTRPQLLAVDSSDNRSKGDQDPSQWKPPSRDYWCAYAKDWITVKAYWHLSVTTAERSALTDMLDTCS
jgi:hypothetical protein